MKRYGLIGFQLSHSWSPVFFGEKFAREQMDAEYRLFPLERIEQFPAFLEKEKSLSGLNVTIPHKTNIIPFLDDLSPEAAKIGAVNTIQFVGKKLIGHNTDAYGFQQTLTQLDLNKVRGALILGTGGASKAVAFVLEKLDIPFQIVSRNKSGSLLYSELNQAVTSRNNLVVNCTPAGTFPLINERPPIALELFSEDTFLIDLIYNPPQTSLMAAAAARGAQTMNGLKMLQIQAERAWQIWQA
jgi:shikimate dehydrogenase